MMGLTRFRIKVTPKIQEMYEETFNSKTIDNIRFDFVTMDYSYIGMAALVYSENSIPQVVKNVINLEQVIALNKFLVLGGEKQLCEKIIREILPQNIEIEIFFYKEDEPLVLLKKSNNQISNNHIHDNEGNGIWLEDADNNIVEDNLIYNSGIITNAMNGIFLSSNSGNNFISDNDISHNSLSGIRLNDSTFNATITNNRLYNNSRFGIWVDNVANSNNFVNNTIIYNYDYGLAFDSATSNSYVTLNRFINNAQLMTSQAWDVGSENVFSSNYWNEWTSPDLNLDGIVDRPYLIDGSINNQDLFPLVYGYDTFDLVYQDLTLNQNESFTIELGEILIFNQCIVPEKNNIRFSGEGTLKVLNSDFYHLIIESNLKVQIISSKIAYTEMRGQSLARYENVIFQQFYASDNATSIFIDCAVMKIYDGSPIPGSISSGTMVKAGGFSRIICAPYFNTGRWGSSPAGIIWTISASTYDKIDSLVSLKDIVDFEFYIEGFNPNPTSTSKNISIRFYVGEILEEAMLCESTVENWNWKINLQFNTSKYSNGVYWLKVVINDSTVENRIIFPFFINNIDHTISEPTVVYPNGGETLSGEVTIQWLAATDSLYHPISYSLLYSSNAGNNWTIIASGLTVTNYVWDTTTVDIGTDYLIRIIATCSSGLSADDISNDVFTIIDIQTTTDPTTTTEPTTTEHPTTTIPTITPSFTVFPFLIGLLVNLAFLRRLRK